MIAVKLINKNITIWILKLITAKTRFWMSSLKPVKYYYFSIHYNNTTCPHVFNMTISAFATCNSTSWSHLSQFNFEISSYQVLVFTRCKCNKSKGWLKQNAIRRWNFKWNGYKSYFYLLAFAVKWPRFIGEG